MSKGKLTLLIIVLIVIVAGFLGYFYFYQPINQNGDDTGGGTNFFADFFPFGKSKDVTSTKETPPTDVSGFEPTKTETTDLKLKKVSSFPIAGYGVYMKERYKEIEPPAQPSEETGLLDTLNNLIVKPTTQSTEFVPALRYVDKATGNIYQTFADKIDERRFSEIIVPRVYEALMGNKGESVVMRYLKTDAKTIETFVGTLPKEYLGADLVGTNEVKGSFLPENISDLSLSPDTTKIFYLFNLDDSAIGVIYELQTNSKTQIFNSPFTEWLSFWPNNKMITLTTKPSANVPGYMYAINTDTKSFNKILSNINGLTTLTSPNGEMILYSNNNLSLNILNTKTGNSDLLGVKTLPEKCVWGRANDTIYCAVPKYLNQASYPDSWYQGEISFSDEIWKINVENGTTIMILDPLSIEGGPASPSQDGEDVDAIKLNLDENENYLFFVNKKDSYLWELYLK